MKLTLSNNEANLKMLQDLIDTGIYTGFKNDAQFEFTRNRFPNNFRIIGTLDASGFYSIQSDFTATQQLVGIFLMAFGVLISISYLIEGLWMLPLTLFFVGLLFFIVFQLEKKKEMAFFTKQLNAYRKSVPYTQF